jgi:hypothetical protein
VELEAWSALIAGIAGLVASITALIRVRSKAARGLLTQALEELERYRDRCDRLERDRDQAQVELRELHREVSTLTHAAEDSGLFPSLKLNKKNHDER